MADDLICILQQRQTILDVHDLGLFAIDADGHAEQGLHIRQVDPIVDVVRFNVKVNVHGVLLIDSRLRPLS